MELVDEDRCRVRTGHLPRNLACLTSLAISIVRIQGRFDSLPPSPPSLRPAPLPGAVQRLLVP